MEKFTVEIATDSANEDIADVLMAVGDVAMHLAEKMRSAKSAAKKTVSYFLAEQVLASLQTKIM